MTVKTAQRRLKSRRSAPHRGMCQRRPETLHDLLEAIRAAEPERSHLVAMLGATAAHVCMCLDQPPEKIAIAKLLDLKHDLKEHLRRVQRLKRNSIHLYTNYYLRVLIRKAREFGWAECAPEVTESWRGILEAAAKTVGLRGIVQWAIRNGRRAADFTENDLDQYAEAARREGRGFLRVTQLKRTFRKVIFEAGLSSTIPNLLPPAADRTYRIPLPAFPGTLRSQVLDLLKWKTATFSRGRTGKGQHRLVTADHFRSLICRIFGFLVKIKGKAVHDLADLFSEESVSDFVEWAVNERKMKSCALAPYLGTIHSLRSYPPLASIDFRWLPRLASQLPKDSDIQAKARKDRKWVSYDELIQIPDKILRDANDIPDLSEKKRAERVRDGLLMAWTTTLAWRSRNVRETKVMPFGDGGNLFKEEIPAQSAMAIPQWVREALRLNPHEAFWQFLFRPEETKNGNMVRAVLPRQLVAALENYLERYRPLLVNGTDGHTLFLNDHGRPFSQTTLRNRVGNLSLRYVGRRVNPHLIRDIFAVQFLQERPEDYLTLSKILWHRNPKTTVQVYGAGFDESYGARSVEEWLDARDKRKK